MDTVTVATVTRRGRPRRQYNCGYCARAFKRSEHCTRHERSHTHEKPYSCRYCHKTYARKDLVTRHEQTLHAQVYQRRIRDPGRAADEATVDSLERAAHPASGAPLSDGVDVARETDSLSGRESLDIDHAQPNNAVSPSLSPVSSASSCPVGIGERRMSSHSPVAADADNMPEIICRIPTQSPGSTSTAATQHDDPLLPRTHTPSTIAQPRQRNKCLSSFTTTSDSAACHPLAVGRPLDSMEADLVIDMALDGDLPISQGRDKNNAAEQQYGRYNPHDHAPFDQEPTHFFLSPMQSLNLDLSTFTFPTLPNQPAGLHHDHLMSLSADNFMTQDFQAEDIQPFSDTGYLPTQNSLPHVSNAFTATAGTQKSHNTSHNLPLLNERRQSIRAPVLDDLAYASLRNDLAQRLGQPESTIELPPAKVCQQFLFSYIKSFHCHLPIIHIRSTSPRTTPAPLILAMCSIGALYRLDRRRARSLYKTATLSLETVSRAAPENHQALVSSLWFAQARTLLAFYAVMSGEEELITKAMQTNGFFTLVYNKARNSLPAGNKDSSLIDWPKWIEHESWKRLLGGLFITSTLTMVLFDVNPGFNSTQDLEFEMFEDDSIWNAPSSAEWQEIRNTTLAQQQNQRRRTLKEVLADIMLDGNFNPSKVPYQVSAFSALILMHGVVVHMWQRLQVSQALTAPIRSCFTSDGCDDLEMSLLDSAMRTLERCSTFLNGTVAEVDGFGAEDEETSLVFNCRAILRIAYIKLFKPLSSSHSLSLMKLDPDEMDAAISSFVTAKMERGPHILNAITKCFEGLRIPVKLGHMLVRKTAALRWSVEHAIAGWESALLITKWLDTVELDAFNGTQLSAEERKLLALIKELLEEAGNDLSEGISLAATAARTWGLFLQDVWVWGITPQMGAALELLAKAYERVGMANRRVSLNTSVLPL